MLREPTKGDNTLDLVITNTPQMVSRIETPGLSDHDIVYFEYKNKTPIKKTKSQTSSHIQQQSQLATNGSRLQIPRK